MRQSLRARFWLECLLSLITGFTALATAIDSHWIESVTGMDPDGGNGSAEWLVTLILAVITLVALVAARVEWRRGRAAAASARG